MPAVCTAQFLILHGGSDITVPIRSAERIANAIRSRGNSGVTVRIILGVSHSLLPNPFGPNRSWVYLPAFATSPQLLDVMTNWAATHFRLPFFSHITVPIATLARLELEKQ
jgi:fermentation-respiration switch protein FrsA (DUF1100 family)